MFRIDLKIRLDFHRVWIIYISMAAQIPMD